MEEIKQNRAVERLKYAGIGSRETPGEVLSLMERYAQRFSEGGFILRSGGAQGADSACQKGCEQSSRPQLKDIWWGDSHRQEAWNQQEGVDHQVTTEMHAIAASIHPYWQGMKDSSRYLHARNVGQILGANGNDPVQWVMCWTPDGMEKESERTSQSGGTATAIALADRWGIPVFNLQRQDARARMEAHVLGLKRSFHEDRTTPPPLGKNDKPWIFVFGSNEAGRHGKGAALEAAKHWGAQRGEGRGLQGSSYAIATKDRQLKPLAFSLIEEQIAECVHFIRQHREWNFWVTRVGCELAGFADENIAPLWKGASNNTSFAQPWKPWISTRIIPPREVLLDSMGKRLDSWRPCRP